MHRLSVRLRASLVVPFLALAPASFGHDGDPKVLDTKPAYAGPGWRPGAPAGATFRGSEAFRAGGGPALSFASQGVTLLSWITLGEMDATGGNSCWGYTSPSGREYALMGLSSGIAFVDITDPTYPVIVEKIVGPGSLWRDVKVYQHHAYIVTEHPDGGIQVVDMSGIDQGVVTLVNHVMTGGSGSTHTVALDTTSGFLYRAGGSGNGLRIYDLADPVNPQHVATWSTRYVHEATVLTYTSGPWAGRQIAFLCSGYNNGWSQTRFEILDVTNKSSLFVRGTVFYPGAAYSHQGWTSDDQRYFFLDDELDENGSTPTTTHVIDIQNLNSPSYAGSFTNGNTAVGHNLYVKGDLCYESNYRSGLRVFDVSNPVAGQEVGWFDTWPQDDGAAFNGLWGNYPYYASGAVIGSDREKGLFVWWVGEPLLAFDYPNGTPALVDPAGSSVLVRIDEATPGNLVPGTEVLRYAVDGSGWADAPLVPLGGGLYRADFPSLPCGRAVEWYVGARSTNGWEWRSPAGSPAAAHRARIAFAETVLVDEDFETSGGWSRDVANDDALTGLWEHGVPTGSPDGAAPAEDHSDVGAQCWVTGLTSQVDHGTTSLVSPSYDLTGTVDPVIGYWRWYAKDVGQFASGDELHVYASNDGGASWVEVEVVEGRTPETAGGWFHHWFNLRDFLAPTAEVRVKIVASDLGYGSTIEAALDDFRITDCHCDCNQNLVADDEEIDAGTAEDCNANLVPDECDLASGSSTDANGNGVPDECDCTSGQSYCTAHPNSAGPGAHMGMAGTTSVSANDLWLRVDGSVPGQFGLFFYGPDAIETPFGDGALCVGAGSSGLFRLNPPAPSDATGSAERRLDFTVPPASQGPGEILPGSTWRFQYWYRDPMAGGAGFNLSDGLELYFCN